MAKANRDVPHTGAKRKVKAGLSLPLHDRRVEAAIESFLLQAKIEAITPCPRKRTIH